MSSYYPKTLKQWRVQKLPSSDDLNIRPRIPSKHPSFKSQVIHSFDHCASNNHLPKPQLQPSNVRSRPAVGEGAGEGKGRNFLIRQARHSSCDNMPTGDRCMRKFERLIKAEQAVKISSNLNMIVRNFIMSCTTKRRDVKKARKETIRMQQNNSVLAGVLHISTPRLLNTNPNANSNMDRQLPQLKQPSQKELQCEEERIEEDPTEEDSFSPYYGKKTVIDLQDKAGDAADQEELRMSFITIKEMNIKQRSRQQRDAIPKQFYSSLNNNHHWKLPQHIHRKIGSNSTTLQPNSTVTITPWDNQKN